MGKRTRRGITAGLWRKLRNLSHATQVSDVGGEIIVSVNHNQNANLQPNERMVRTTCLNCHGLEYSLNSLADPHVIDHGVQGRPSVQIQSLDWVRDRLGDIDPNRFGAFGE